MCWFFWFFLIFLQDLKYLKVGFTCQGADCCSQMDCCEQQKCEIFIAFYCGTLILRFLVESKRNSPQVTTAPVAEKMRRAVNKSVDWNKLAIISLVVSVTPVGTLSCERHICGTTTYYIITTELISLFEVQSCALHWATLRLSYSI